MRIVVCPALGPLSNLLVEEQPDPTPGNGQVVVAVRAAGVNFVDGLICQGGYQLKPATPFTPGMEIAGEVAAVGAGSGFAVGDRVMAMTGFGGFASHVALSASSLIRVPDSIELTRAATIIQSYGTAMFALTRRTHVGEREWVLVLGGGGGVGLATVDVARALGARVIAAASSREKLDAALQMGAEAAIDYEEEDLKARARELSGGGVDVVVDPVGGRFSEPALRALRVFGRFCVIGFASGAIAPVPLNQALLNNRTIVGVDWGAWTFREPEANKSMLAEVVAMVADGRLHPTTPVERPLEDAATVMAELIDRNVVGKVVLVPDQRRSATRPA
ncbi:MAG: NADPH:quinone oxidoreductase family protein [Acidimicrobiales bacterium]